MLTDQQNHFALWCWRTSLELIDAGSFFCPAFWKSIIHFINLDINFDFFSSVFILGRWQTFLGSKLYQLLNERRRLKVYMRRDEIVIIYRCFYMELISKFYLFKLLVPSYVFQNQISAQRKVANFHEGFYSTRSI